ncbi:hypothetical protein OSB04_017426 [Centaurea solstitialis]|uniref:Transposase n=1 Tax=Centaurea solstitialis TaxID=347529 RepID=A0AA38TG22_9ASTR|nr:hypothetical protein OSB04_017426 [Centaurea solstitialis]
MDNSWMSLSRVTIEYQKSLEEFLDIMLSNEGSNGQILCPCIKCGNEVWVNREEARMHLICDGFFRGYRIPPSMSQPSSFPTSEPSSFPTSGPLDDMQGLVRDAFCIPDENTFEDGIGVEDEISSEPNEEAKKFYKLLEDAEKELYPGCKKFSVLSFIVRLLHSKCVGKCNDKGFTMLLDTLIEAFPDASIPKSLYEMKKIIKNLGLSYEKIDACPNDCMLYWKGNSKKTECDICHTSRYRQRESDLEDQATTSDNQNKIGAKVLRYFPLKPRLQRLFMSSKNAAFMRWHEESRTKDGCMRHPADSPAWKTFDFNYSSSAKEPRNVRLGLASDGFNPFRTMSVSHSTWPVVLMPYNLPPWMCMKQPYFMLSLLIAGPSAPGNNIDVYLEPLAEELKDLHNLDVMHIEKNVCDSVVGTLMNLDGKTKDHIKARLDLQEMGIRPELHPKAQDNDKVYLPPAWFSMDKNEKEIFCRVLKKVKVPYGYAANISRCVQLKPPKIFGLKSHDNHILMQQLLSLALRKVLPKHVRHPLMNLSRYYRQLCSKVLQPQDLIGLENMIAKTLCDLERIFPPSFFNVMVHLSVHLASEAKIAGPVHYRWMYPIERYLSTLKSYVRNKSKPEGSIAEGYLAEECLSFCSLYLSDDVETKRNRRSRNYDDGGTPDVLPIFSMSGRPVGAIETTRLDLETLAQAHLYVLFNCNKVDEFINEHLKTVRDQNRRLCEHDVQRIHSETFATWFRNHVEELHIIGDQRITNELRVVDPALLRPDEMIMILNLYLVNRFHTKEVERKRKTQNSGVVLEAKTSSFSSARDNNPVVGDVTYYGVLNDIIELEYSVGKKVVLFKCDWISNGKRKREDENGFTLLNFQGSKPNNEPFILACQAQQVFYVADPVDKEWQVMIKTTARDTYDMTEQPCLDHVDTYLQSEVTSGFQLDENMDIDLT